MDTKLIEFLKEMNTNRSELNVELDTKLTQKVYQQKVEGLIPRLVA